MKTEMQWLLMALCGALFVELATAQIVRRIEGPAGEIFDLPELGALILGGEKEIKVDFVAPKDMRPKGYESVDLKAGDVVLLLNGKRVKSIAAIKEVYEAAAIADTMKMGIRRDSEMFFVSFKKADPKMLPRRKIVIDDEPEGEGPEGDKKSVQAFSFKSSGDKADDVRPLLELGVLVGVVDKKIKVMQKLSLPGSAPPADLQAGDFIEMLNGKAFTSPEEFLAMFEKIPIGEKVVLQYVRDAKTISATFTKPEARGRVMIRKVE